MICRVPIVQRCNPRSSIAKNNYQSGYTARIKGINKIKNIWQRICRKRSNKIHDIKKRSKCEMQEFLRPTMALIRVTGLFPVEGVNSSIRRMRFNLKSWYCLYYALTCLSLLTSTSLLITWSVKLHIFSTGIIVNLLLNITGVISMILLFNLAQNWPTMIRQAAIIEDEIKDLKKDRKNNNSGSIVFYIFFSLCFAKHILETVFYLKLLCTWFDLCEMTSENMRILLEFSVPFVFYYTSFSMWKFIVHKIVVFKTIILAGITDVIPMCLCLYLTSYIKDLNNIIEFTHEKDARFWKRQREMYTHLEALVSLVNIQINKIMLLSFLTYICLTSVQLFSLISVETIKMGNKIVQQGAFVSTGHIFYFSFASMFHILRAFTMSVLAANVHIEGRRPLLALYQVKDLDDNSEVRRFRCQMIYNPITMSTSFFTINRKMVLKVFSTIVTYELVLLQLFKNHKIEIDYNNVYENNVTINQ